MQSKTTNSKIHFMTKCGVLAAVICIFSPLTLPVGPVPVTLGLFAVMLSGIVLKPKESIASVSVFILLGMCGLPVFSGAKAGLSVLAGPTGGYIWSYIISAFLGSVISHLKPKGSLYFNLAACICAMIVCYLFGTLQFVALTEGFTFASALKVCVYPFVLFDLIKAVCASILGKTLKNRMR